MTILTIWTETIIVTFDTFDQSDEETRHDPNKNNDKDQDNDRIKDNPRILWHLRHWLQFWQLRTWIHDHLCDLTIKSDTGQHLQFLRCLVDLSLKYMFRLTSLSFKSLAINAKNYFKYPMNCSFCNVGKRRNLTRLLSR